MAAPSPNPLIRALAGASFLKRNRVAELVPVESAIGSNTNHVLLYFSAHWCPPCRQFTPILSKFYKDHHKSKNFEVVFCSWDRTEDEFSTYFSTHPDWLAIDRSLIDNLATAYNIQTIPTLLVLDAKTGQIVTRQGRLGVAHDPTAKEFPWRGHSFTSHVNVNAPKNAVLIGGVATVGASLLLWIFAQGNTKAANTAAFARA
eukprot:GILK01022823.1.p1 GENE.GILK01022823.1~~GILK01022823.1.p1  ORF type:complete len:202 (+),score=10.82 GILK01022823.1:109-714(+)